MIRQVTWERKFRYVRQKRQVCMPSEMRFEKGRQIKGSNKSKMLKATWVWILRYDLIDNYYKISVAK
jgi:hypothetical protein